VKGFGLIILRVLMGTFCTALATLPTVSKAADLQDRPSVYPGLTCLSAPYDTSGDGAETRITELISTLRQSIASFPSLQKALRIRAPDICTYSTTFDARGFYDPVANLIALNANMTRGAQLAILIHELRHLDQESVGACPSPNLSMQETARAVFALEADANATVVLIAHALRKAGNPGPWEAIQGFPHYKDIADVFLESIEEINDPGLAMAEAFSQWYEAEWRRERYYISTCSDYLDRQDVEHRLPTYQLLQPDFLEQLCRMPDGTPYSCSQAATGSIRYPTD